MNFGSNARTWGGILTGFGMLFVGLSLMSGSMEDFAALEGVKTFLAKISNPLLLVLIGAVLTAIIQSSSVMTSIALAMCVTSLRLHYVNDNMLQAPPIAVAQTKREVLRMAELSMENFDRSINTISTLDFSDKDKFDNTEQELNFINQALVDFVVKLSDRRGFGGHDKFSDEALYEICQLKILVHTLYDKSMSAYVKESLKDLEQANAIEEQIDDFTKRMEDSHIERLGKGICNANTGAQYMELSSNTERIADHLINVAKTIRVLRG